MNSFDVFDTAIFRKVYQPKDIFRLIENKVGKDFFNKRVNAEHEARKHKKNYDIDDIYALLPEFDMQLEIDLELENCYANPLILSTYKNGDIFISDMYLHAETIEAMLRKCGYLNPKVYVSGDVKACKGDGTLFKYVEEHVGKIDTHYGDNYQSDIVQANKLGIKTKFLPNLENRQQRLPMVKDTIIKKYLAEIEASDLTPIDKLASYYAPIFITFAKWVVKHQRGNKIHYLARDMYFPYIFTKFYLQADCDYLYANRKSLSTLLLKSKYKKLNDKAKIILTPQEQQERIKRDENEILCAFRHLKDGDIIVDIGYTGTIQLLLEEFLDIDLQGLYLQTDKEMEDFNYEMYLNRFALIYRFMVEFAFSSPEEQLVDYIDGSPVFGIDNRKRIQYAKAFEQQVLRCFSKLKDIELSVFDVEQILIHLQLNPSQEMLEIYNEPIMSNRQGNESIINCDKDRIRRGELLETYRRSYAKPLYKKILQQDVELAYLVKYLPD